MCAFLSVTSDLLPARLISPSTVHRISMGGMQEPISNCDDGAVSYLMKKSQWISNAFGTLLSIQSEPREKSI